MEISLTYWSIIKRAEKNRKIQVSIDIIYLWDLFLKQNRKCALSGVNLVLDSFGKKDNIKRSILKENEYFASLDRIDNKLGYIEGNVRWIARDINNMKWKLEEDKFLFFIKKISENYE